MGGVERVKRLGLLGGTFDPPHWGHLWLAETARAQLALDRVLFLPVGDPPHKQERPITAVPHRLTMIELATRSNPHFVVDTTDAKRPPPHTTVSLLPLMQAAYPQAKIWLVIGGDSLRDFPTWVDPHDIIEQCRLAVLPRLGAEVDWLELETAVPQLRRQVDMLDGPTIALSATAIRKWAKTNHSLRYLVDTAVLDYIQAHSLYPKTD